MGQWSTHTGPLEPPFTCSSLPPPTTYHLPGTSSQPLARLLLVPRAHLSFPVAALCLGSDCSVGLGGSQCSATAVHPWRGGRGTGVSLGSHIILKLATHCLVTPVYYFSINSSFFFSFLHGHALLPTLPNSC